ncbi:hypothetical protein TSAR_006470 [Trichomalopsis sarcophagae]|uniref:Uncharacterized protein n=1 Tax=Trichomalopsis sarcophagae TaxID=543379 RepID=A0A232ETE1_9HYME|nr:hypothetical protein TSAR_006470 [Trichomalopsis sarcophagae]
MPDRDINDFRNFKFLLLLLALVLPLALQTNTILSHTRYSIDIVKNLASILVYSGLVNVLQITITRKLY